MLNRASRWGLCAKPPLLLEELCAKADRVLFAAVLGDGGHVLHPLLPPRKPNLHSLRRRAHSLGMYRIANSPDTGYRIIPDTVNYPMAGYRIPDNGFQNNPFS